LYQADVLYKKLENHFVTLRPDFSYNKNLNNIFMKINTDLSLEFRHHHNGSIGADVDKMLHTIGISSLDKLIEETVPANIRLKKPLNLPKALSEQEFLTSFKKTAQKNKKYRSYIGMGYYDTIVPNVILRNILENPGWYTAYTPYQAEIAQGRLEALINFQTIVIDLTGMEIANASLLDEATAAAEAMAMLYNLRKNTEAKTLFVDKNMFPQTIDVLITRSKPMGIALEIADLDTFEASSKNYFAVFVQYPNGNGSVEDFTKLCDTAHANDTMVGIATDLLALTILKSPGSMGADVVFGTSQRFGVPMGYGGPHAGFFATKDANKRLMPGRIIGASIDTHGNKAYRMALGTREQHIRREKATSNICTAQVLLSVMAGMYGVYHGPSGLINIAERVHGLTALLATELEKLGFNNTNRTFFDTLKVNTNGLKAKIEAEALSLEINFRYFEDENVGISLDESTTVAELNKIIAVFAKVAGKAANQYHGASLPEVDSPINGGLIRKDTFMQQSVFNKYHSEHEMLRYIKHLESKDLSLCHSMISLGSCTMKLNATAEMIPVTWPEFNLHPFVPLNQAEGYTEMFGNLEKWLCEITGFDAMSLQPNSGAQGEYAGLMVIMAYHQDNGNTNRNVVLIPTSAHGTNPASAAMAGMKIVLVKCDEKGNIDVADLKDKANANKENLAGLMVTYPSTHGVFEETIIEICDTIHQNGGLVYMDGANMNAQVGLTSPANIGADVCHLNLHKTFCIPHGGGGPGMGPIGVVAKLAPYLPGHSVVKMGREKSIHAVSAAPWGSASILPISYAYIAMMGGEGLTEATRIAILNANYIKAKLEKHYPILYTGTNGRVAHEMIVDFRQFKHSLGVEVEDVAKRLMDYGYHAPTVSFPVAGTLMIEPTESEAVEELDRFCDALIAIKAEIEEIASGTADKVDNVLKNAPHTAAHVIADEWKHGYTREKAAYPTLHSKLFKFWPTVGRVDNAYGDRNLVCSCDPIENYA
jgi:glycine dehydrogenase